MPMPPLNSDLNMTYSLTSDGRISRALDNGATLFLPPESNGTPEWRAYQAWLDEGNEPEPPPPPPPPAPDYFAFWEALIQTSAYQSIRTQATADLVMNTAATEFIALIGDAKMGRPFEAAIQGSILAVLSTGTFTEGELLEFQGALEAGHLDSIYSLEAPES